ncbi:MAG TPA: 3-dehydroquinate synthase family protein [Acidimicrobiia bacterium]|nr:3-dehydroquinate synthase family protein [Acidimicrobiia bacterium]
MERLLIAAETAPATSEILIGRGLPVPLLPERGTRSQIAVLTQPGAARIARVVAAAVGGAEVMELPDRDAAKSLTVAETVYRWLAELGVGRGDTIMGVGGGAVTDLAGFVAATWLRGIEGVMVPTTLLGAVDAAIGGKSGLNLDGKNLVGAFHLPTRVIIDLDVLDRIPIDVRLEGIAEALKAGLVGDPDLVGVLVRHGAEAPLDEVVPKAVRVKVDVVNRDYRDGDLRSILNFGHTIGHAIEVVAGMPHGLAVAVGMVAAGALSEHRYGFPAGWLTDLVFSLGLPVAASGSAPAAVADLIRLDKKRTPRATRMVLLRAVGDPVVEAVTDEEIDRALQFVGIR